MTEPPELRQVLDFYGVQFKEIEGNQRVSCPLHDDRTPSLSVHLGKQVVRCFSCELKGSSWQLIMAKEGGISFVEAKRIATQHGFRAGDSGEGGQEVSRSSYGRRGRVSDRPRKNARHRNGGWTPTWGRH